MGHLSYKSNILLIHIVDVGLNHPHLKIETQHFLPPSGLDDMLFENKNFYVDIQYEITWKKVDVGIEEIS
jgi:hypothetical protein